MISGYLTAGQNEEIKIRKGIKRIAILLLWSTMLFLDIKVCMSIIAPNAGYTFVLIVGGFFVPPLGIIDGSVLTAVGELLMFGVLAQVPKILDAVRNGKSIKLQKGDFGVEVSAEAKEE